MTQASDLLFVYGTLRRDHRRRLHPLLRPFSRFIGPANAQARLYDLGSYPGLVLSTEHSDRVQGELYQILSPAKAWPRLDAYEECTPGTTNPEYRRELITVTLSDGSSALAWCYVYNRKTIRQNRIINGDYQNRQNPSHKFVPSPIKISSRHPVDRRKP